MMKVKRKSQNLLHSVKDDYLTRDRSITVETDNKTGDVTIDVTLFDTVGERVFDRLPDTDRRKWVNSFFDGTQAPRIREYKLIVKGH